MQHKIPHNARLCDTVAELLSVSVDAAYRRIRGEKELSLNELRKICTRFKISVDHLMTDNVNSASLWFHSISEPDMEAYYDYLDILISRFEVASISLKKEMFMSVNDVNIFHKLPYYHLTCLEIFKWYRTVNGATDFEGFMKRIDEKRVREISSKFCEVYVKIPRTEFWCDSSLDNLLYDIDCYNDMEVFSDPATIIAICEEVDLLLDHLKSTLIEYYTNSRPEKPQLSFYVSPSRNDGNFIYFEYDDTFYSLISCFNTFSVSSTDRIVGEEGQKWIRHLTARSTLISGTSERERHRFFQHLEAASDSIRQKFQRMVL